MVLLLKEMLAEELTPTSSAMAAMNDPDRDVMVFPVMTGDPLDLTWMAHRTGLSVLLEIVGLAAVVMMSVSASFIVQLVIVTADPDAIVIPPHLVEAALNVALVAESVPLAAMVVPVPMDHVPLVNVAVPPDATVIVELLPHV